MGRDKHTNKHTNRHCNTMNRPGLRAGSIENGDNSEGDDGGSGDGEVGLGGKGVCIMWLIFTESALRPG